MLSIVIPCLNEKKTIGKVIQDAYTNAKRETKNNFEIIVSDNGSTDGSLEKIKKYKFVRLVKVPVRGYGAALHWGILKSRGEYVLFGDADLSYPFSNLNRFLLTISADPDLVLGSRLRGEIEKGAMPRLNRFLGTPILTWLIRTVYKIPTSDCNSGMRMVRRKFYKNLNMRNSGMEWASELLLKTALRDGRYMEIPIKFRKDQRNKSPHLSRWSDGWRHLKAIMLLKPSSLYGVLVGLIILSIIFYPSNFALSFLCLLLSVVLTLSLATLHLLRTAIEKTTNRVSEFLLQFKLVPLTVLICSGVVTSVILIPDNRLGTKLFLVSLLGTIAMWIFLVETIKTHLVNRLPDQL